MKKVACLALVPAALFAQANSVFIEDLTWEEVAAALKAGKTTALFYAGGGEQNGSHMAFGKHTIVAHHVVERIARELGNALVYPVMPFSPNGDPAKKAGMMNFPGSTSITDETFGLVARDIAQSAATAGFRDIILMGDHGGGQEALKKTALELDGKLKPSGVRVFYAGDVYTKSRDEFRKYLEEHRVKGDGHAGVQDTSEIMLLKPEWIRRNKINDASQEKGVMGDPRPATPELGKVLLDMKVRFAGAQIRALVGGHSSN